MNNLFQSGEIVEGDVLALRLENSFAFKLKQRARHDRAVAVTINDFGATPGMVTLRLEQALEESEA